MFFKKKQQEQVEDDGQDAAEAPAQPQLSGNVEIELTKIKSQLEAMSEVRKSNAERFSRVSEQIGELRGMIVDTNKTMTNVEVASTKAIDLVTAVHPDQLMVEVRKSEGKVEALKANIEANEAMMQDIMKSLKDIRKAMAFYKGTEQVIKINEEVKNELFEIKKIQAVVHTHADRVDTIFLEVEKKFSEFNKFNDTVKDLSRQMEKLQSDFDKLRVAVEQKEDKKEFVNLLTKFNNFEKHTTNILKLLDVKMKTIEFGSRENFRRLAEDISAKLKVQVDAEKIQKDTDAAIGNEQEEKPKLTLKSLFKKGDAAAPTPEAGAADAPVGASSGTVSGALPDAAPSTKEPETVQTKTE